MEDLEGKEVQGVMVGKDTMVGMRLKFLVELMEVQEKTVVMEQMEVVEVLEVMEQI